MTIAQTNFGEQASLSDRRLAYAAELLQAGISACGMPIILFAPDDSVAYVSEGFRKHIGLPDGPSDFSGLVHYWFETGTGPQIPDDPQAWIRVANARRRKYANQNYQIIMADGRWFMVTETLLEGGWVWNFLTDITHLRQTKNELKIARDAALKESEIDPLTGIFNRRFATEDLDLQVRKSHVDGMPLSITLVDLDLFKNVNDTYGHETGDEVLSHFTMTASWLLRRTDTFARYGGEEFLIIMPGATVDQAETVVDRIRHEIECNPMSEPAVRYTFSSGIAALRGEDAAGLLRRADAALYRAKADGRNCSRIAD